MTKDKAAKYNGKWVQVKADNMEAVSLQTCITYFLTKNIYQYIYFPGLERNGYGLGLP